MSKFQRYSSYKVVLQDVLEYLDEILDSRQRDVLKLGPDATVAEVQHKLGIVRGIEMSMTRLQQNIGGEQIDESMYDTRY